MTENQPHGRVLPEDLNDVDAWYELEFNTIDDYIKELVARAAELSHDTYRELLPEFPQDSDIFIWSTELARAASDPIDKFRRLQEPLYNIGGWPGWESADRNAEFLEIWWAISDVAKELPGDPEDLSRVLAAIMDDPEIWYFPLAPTAIIATHHLREQDLRLVLQTFVDAWDLSSDTPTFNGSHKIDIPDGAIDLAAPLIAVASLNPQAPMELVDAVLRIATFGDDDRLRLAFWEYVSACLTDDRVYAGYWDPLDVWRSGFFGNGLAKDAPPMDAAHVMRVLTHFKEHASALDLANTWGEQTVAPQVMTFLAQRTDTDPQVLADIALNCPWVDPVQAVIANPNTPDTAKAAGALRLP
jgi:hypothetical protein